METIPAMTQAIGDNGATAFFVVALTVAVAKLYGDVKKLNERIAEMSSAIASKDAIVIEALNKSSDALNNNSATITELKIIMQTLLDRSK